MTQQERIMKLAQEKIAYLGNRGRLWGKSFKVGFEGAVRFTLANLWISVDEDLPEFIAKVDGAQISKTVIVKCTNGTITRAQYVGVSGEVPASCWTTIDAGFCIRGKVTHWMPIPELPEGGVK